MYYESYNYNSHYIIMILVEETYYQIQRFYLYLLFMERLMKILVIIPAYNEADNIEYVVNNLILNYPQYDYLVVNDGSTDNTEEICQNNHYNYVTLPTNLGIGGGMQTGYLFAKYHEYDIAVQIDGDGQHNPEYIKLGIDEILNGADMVIGSRFIEKEGFQSSIFRRIGINLLSFIIKLLCKKKIYDVTSGFRICNKKMIEFFSHTYAQDYPEPEAIMSALLNGYKVKEIPVIMNGRIQGESSISSFKSIYYMIKVSISLCVTRITMKRRGEI